MPSYNQVFAVSSTSQKHNKLSTQQIQHFKRSTSLKTKGSKANAFKDYYTEHDIVLIQMPPCSSYLLEPFDIGCFGLLKTDFRKQNQQLIRNRIFYTRNGDFLASVYTAFKQFFYQRNILGEFGGSGLHSFNPEAVISQQDPAMLSLATTPSLSSVQE